MALTQTEIEETLWCRAVQEVIDEDIINQMLSLMNGTHYTPVTTSVVGLTKEEEAEMSANFNAVANRKIPGDPE